MTQPLRVLLATSVLAIGTLAIGTDRLPGGQAFAQAMKKQDAAKPAGKAAEKPGAEPQAEAPKVIALTQAQIDGLLSAQPELAKIQGGSGDGKPNPKPDPKAREQAEAIAKKSGFASMEELEDVGDNVEAVLAGVDPETKTYVGLQPLLKKQIAAVEADKSLKPKDKAAALKELKEAQKGGEPPKPSDGNIALVTQNYDKLVPSQGGQQ